jgi:hypothetical protein
LQGEGAQAAVTTKGEEAMAFLTEPSERYQASYLEALQEFQAQGRHLEPPLEEIAADFARFVQHLRELADRTKLKPGWVPVQISGSLTAATTSADFLCVMN